jgi:drug/metabolite transporter (DMT)-like permease
LFLAVLSIFVLKERHRKTLLFALALGFAGVVILLHPTINRGQALAGLLGLASGLLAGVAYLNVSQLGKMNEPEWRVVFYFTLVSTVGAGIWMLLHEFHPVTWKSFALLAGLGTTATLAQLAMTRAYRVGRTMVAGSLAYSTVVFASLFGLLLWGETLTLESWLGIALIILSGVVSVRTTQPRQTAL